MDIGSDNNTVTNNALYSVFPKLSEHGIALEAGATNCTVSSNIISGKYTSLPIKDVGTGNTISDNNQINEFLSYKNSTA